MERIAEVLVGDARFAATDAYSYNVGGYDDVPRYACYEDRLGPPSRPDYDRYGKYEDAYRDCEWLRDEVRQRPGYYDTHRFRGRRDLFDKPRPRRELLHRP